MYLINGSILSEEGNMFLFFNKKKRQAIDRKNAAQAEAIVANTIEVLDKATKEVEAANVRVATYDLAEKFYYATRRNK